MAPTRSTSRTSVNYRNVPGAALTIPEREHLRVAARDGASSHQSVIVSIGGDKWAAPLWCFRAGSAAAIIIAVNIHSDATDEPVGDTNASIVYADSATYGATFQGPIHLLFIDGDHAVAAIYADLDAWTPHISTGGIVLLHDYAPSDHDCFWHPEISDVGHAVDHWFTIHSMEWEKVGVTGSIIAFRKRDTPSSYIGGSETPVIAFSSGLASRVTAITVNYKTHDITKAAITSLRKFYPNIHYILVDNSSRDDSAKLIEAYRKFPNYTVIINSANIGHGPAMHQAISGTTTPFFFTFDSDCEMTKSGILEAMLARMDANPQLYAVGWLRYVDKSSGVPHEWHTTPPPVGKQFIPYIHPCAGLYRLSMYRQLPAFLHHGAPCLSNMREAWEKGFAVEDFGIAEYIHHLEAGTRRMYGGHWSPTDKTKPRKWDAKQRFPI